MSHLSVAQVPHYVKEVELFHSHFCRLVAYRMWAELPQASNVFSVQQLVESPHFVVPLSWHSTLYFVILCEVR